MVKLSGGIVVKTTIQELHQGIQKRRQQIAEYKEEVRKVEEAEVYDHPYWQGLTDELGWEKEALEKDLGLLKDLQDAQ